MAKLKIVINCGKSVHGVHAKVRFRRTFAYGKQHHYYTLPLPEHPAHPRGSSAQAMLYRLGHPDQSLSPLQRLTPEAMRQLRDIIYIARQTGGTVHLFGMVDDHSPFGSRRAFEECVRALRQAGIRVALHVGIWHATPHELRRGLQELQSLCSSQVRINSLYPIEEIIHHGGERRYVDGILHPGTLDDSTDIRLPLHRPLFFAHDYSGEHDIFFIANHALHGQDRLCFSLHDNPNKMICFDIPHDTHFRVQDSLDRYNHVVTVFTKPQYERAYFGQKLHHPYYESLQTESAHHAFEMLLSPHFEHHQRPYKTLVLVDDERSPEFDWLLTSVLKRNSTIPFSCVFLEPHSLEGSSVISNQHFTPDRSLYAQLGF
jgi:hypothetical protein